MRPIIAGVASQGFVRLRLVLFPACFTRRSFVVLLRSTIAGMQPCKALHSHHCQEDCRPRPRRRCPARCRCHCLPRPPRLHLPGRWLLRPAAALMVRARQGQQDTARSFATMQYACMAPQKNGPCQSALIDRTSASKHAMPNSY